ncbi:hypothetical protein [Kineothrix sp. MB12-C1]|nr:hypothetical protein [Kineothrix sp. MB12-C1]WMC93465.1 hypothetical protein RBB56_04050 [Kineothrix sp. MB12-C1]
MATSSLLYDLEIAQATEEIKVTNSQEFIKITSAIWYELTGIS